MSNSVLDFLHSAAIKEVGILAVAAVKQVVDAEASKYPVILPAEGLANSFFDALTARLEHLIKHDEEKQAAVAAVAAPADVAAVQGS